MEVRIPAVFKKAENVEILEKFKGAKLEGKTYQPMFPYFQEYKKKKAFRILTDTYVTEESGTGVVHQVRLKLLLNLYPRFFQTNYILRPPTSARTTTASASSSA